MTRINAPEQEDYPARSFIRCFQARLKSMQREEEENKPHVPQTPSTPLTPSTAPTSPALSSDHHFRQHAREVETRMNGMQKEIDELSRILKTRLESSTPPPPSSLSAERRYNEYEKDLYDGMKKDGDSAFRVLEMRVRSPESSVPATNHRLNPFMSGPKAKLEKEVAKEDE